MKDRANVKYLLPARLAAALFVMLFALTILPGTGFAQETEKTNNKRPTVLLILDGFGLNEQTEHNAVALADTPVLDRLMKECPFVEGNASGLAVGLPEGQMGSSEVGHMNIGAGRVVDQDLVRISKEIESGAFFENEALLKAVNNVKEKGTSLHIYGLLSDGGVHSHNTHTSMPFWNWQNATDLKMFMYIASRTGEIHPRNPEKIMFRLCRMKWTGSAAAGSQASQAVIMPWTGITIGIGSKRHIGH